MAEVASQDAATGVWPGAIWAITLFAENVEQTKRFYQDVFGLQTIFEDAVSAVFKFQNTMINLLQTAEAEGLIAPAAVGAQASGARLQLTILVEDVDAICRDLKQRGVEFLNGPLDRTWGMRTAAFADPAGHIWEIAKELDGA